MRGTQYGWRELIPDRQFRSDQCEIERYIIFDLKDDLEWIAPRGSSSQRCEPTKNVSEQLPACG